MRLQAVQVVTAVVVQVHPTPGVVQADTDGEVVGLVDKDGMVFGDTRADVGVTEGAIER